MGNISIAIDPSDSRHIYLAWADGALGSNYTIHVRRSMDGGANWSAQDLWSVPMATNPSLAINSWGDVGLLYQRLVTAADCSPTGCWETRFVRSKDGFQTPADDRVLHRAKDDIIKSIEELKFYRENLFKIPG